MTDKSYTKTKGNPSHEVGAVKQEQKSGTRKFNSRRKKNGADGNRTDGGRDKGGHDHKYA